MYKTKIMKTRIQSLLIAGSLTCIASMAFAGDAAETWNTSCAGCHGKDGSGNTIMGKKAGVADYRDPKVQAKFTDEEASKIIHDGKNKMKSYKDRLTDDQIKGLIAYIRSLKK